MLQYGAKKRGFVMDVEKLYLEVTRMCNLECEHCLRGSSENLFMSDETIINTLKNVKKINRLLITGGEPLFALRQIRTIIQMIKDNNISVNQIVLITNSTILNKEILTVLKELFIISNFKLYLSYDIFHYLELKRLNLLEQRNENAKVLKDLFQAKDYVDFESEIDFEFLLTPIGRALTISQERLEEINSLSRPKYRLSRQKYDTVSQFDTEYLDSEEKVLGTIYIDVNGNIASSGQSFEENDLERDYFNSNINELGFIQSLINFTEYYKEKQIQGIREFSPGFRLKK